MCRSDGNRDGGAVINANQTAQPGLVRIRRPDYTSGANLSYAPGVTPPVTSALSPLANIAAATIPYGRPITQPDGSPWPLDGSNPNAPAPGEAPKPTRSAVGTRDRSGGSRDAGGDRR